MIPDQFLQELKYRSDIEQIIGSYVNLRRRGRTLSGLCPFHSENRPPLPSTRKTSPSTASAAGRAGMSSALSGG